MPLQVSVDLTFDKEETEERAVTLLAEFRKWAKVQCPEAQIGTRSIAVPADGSPFGIFAPAKKPGRPQKKGAK